ncbi:hypothetical protein ACO0RG_002452 [Hanseniaspora osmophila]|uniref:Cytochrome c oxidase chaperone, mitochondrial n=1 Tax=Hanseniaspora osmophila TaxID=56408 RepID=A0A1E5RV66_9ASCO|nr:cytochrome c oxidase chaperone, mitochondrial [Hanseniaspora osmophila]
MFTKALKLNKVSRSQLEVFRFALCLLAPVGVMYYIGIDTHKKLHVEGFWPDPETLNKVPKERYEIEAELARMKKERLQKRLKLQERLINEFGVTDFEEEKRKILAEEAMNKK